MTTIRATCGDCGDVVLGVPDVDVHASASCPTSWYSFVCPVCEVPVIKEASSAAISALLKAGCATRAWGAPSPELPPITAREVADFGRALHRLTDSSPLAGLIDS